MFIPRSRSFTEARPASAPVEKLRAPVGETAQQAARSTPHPWPAALAPLDAPRGGLSEGTLVESRSGWQPIESLAAGDEIFTYDGGLRRIKAITRHAFEMRRTENAPAFLVSIPGGVLGCTATTKVMPEQRLLIESPFLEESHGICAALVRAADLIGISGIRMDLGAAQRRVFALQFEEEEIIWASSGLLCHAPEARAPFGSGFFPELHRHDARHIVRRELNPESGVLFGRVG